MKRFVVIFLLLLCWPVYAQTGSAKSTAALTSEINSLLASGMGITALNLRQVELDITNSFPNLISSVGYVNALTYGVSSSSSDNATALQNAITAAINAQQALYIPASSSCYKYTAPLTIAGSLTVYGDYVAGNWMSGSNIPLGSPPLVGTVLCPSANGSDAIDITGASRQVNLFNIGILFQTTFGQSSTTTGDGIHYVPGSNVQGLSNPIWQNVMVYGHDGNHYAFNIQNPIYGTIIHTASFGGGAWNLAGNSSSGNYGNMTFIEAYGQVVVGGSANGFTISANSSQRLNLITFIRPQSIVNNVSGVSPGGNLPSSSQLIWSEDTNVENIRLIAPDFETNVSSPFTIGTAGVGNDADWAGMFTDAGTINAPAWGTNGIIYGPTTRTFNDTTSLGATGVTAMVAFPATHVTATSAATYSVLATLVLAPPICSTNCTATRTDSLYATGEIYTTSDIGSAGGLFTTGTTQINTNAGSSTTEIGDGTTSGQVTIGGASNTTVMQSATLTMTGISVTPTGKQPLCIDTSTKHIYYGTGGGC